MLYETSLYNAFAGISPHEKGTLIQFLQEQLCHEPRENILEAVDYALKAKPSFGGFVLAARSEGRIIAAIVANRTGMERYSAGHLFVYVVFTPEWADKTDLMPQLMQTALRHAGGQVAMHVPPGHPALKFYQQMGFRAEYLELRLDQKQGAAVA